MDKTWKAVERHVAKALGGRRNPLSGIAGGQGSRGDVIHPELYVEAKHLARAAIATLHAKTRTLGRSEGKVPLTVLHIKGTQDYLVIVDLADFVPIWQRAQKHTEIFD